MALKMKKFEEAKIILLAILGLAVVYNLIGALVFAVIISYISRPLFNFFEKYIKQRTVSATLTTGAIVAVILYPLIMGVRSLAANASQISTWITRGIDEMFEALNYLGISITPEFYGSITEKLLGGFSKILLSTPEFLLEVFILIAMVFYFLRDGDKVRKYIRSLARTEHQAKLIKSMEELLEAVILGYFAMAILMGVIAAVGFWLLGYTSPILFGILVGLGALLPIIGPWIIYLPLAIYEYLQGDYRMVGIVIAFGVLLEILEVYVAPKIASLKARVHPGIMLVGFIGGAMFFGIKGLILGPVILGTLKVVLDHYKS